MSNNSWITYEYEKGMFLSLPSLLRQVTPRTPREIRFAIVESILLHTRNLVDIILSRGAEKDDIGLADLLPCHEFPIVEELRAAYGSKGDIGSPCWTINKMLVHPTKFRVNYFDYSPMLSEITPIIVRFLDQIEEEKVKEGIASGEPETGESLMVDELKNAHDEDVDFSSFFSYLQSDKGHEVVTRVLNMVEDLKKVGIDTATRRVRFEKWLQVIIIGVVIVASSILTYFDKFNATIGVLFGALVGYFFGKK